MVMSLDLIDSVESLCGDLKELRNIGKSHLGISVLVSVHIINKLQYTTYNRGNKTNCSIDSMNSSKLLILTKIIMLSFIKVSTDRDSR